MHTFTYATPTFITEAFYRFTQVQLLLMTYNKLMPYTVLPPVAYSYWVSFYDTYQYAKATPIDDTHYGCPITTDV